MDKTFKCDYCKKNKDNKEKSKKGLETLIKKKDKRTPRQKWIDEEIEKGTFPKPDTKEKLKQFNKAYFEEKSV